MVESVKVDNIVLDENAKTLNIKNTKYFNPKKITGTNLAAILGLNNFKTPFQAWCDMMRVSKESFDENDPKLNAGKIIEPIQARYIKNKYNLVGLVSPTDKFGEDYLSRTHYNFFPESEYFQGMWDYLNEDPSTKQVKNVIEMKTTAIKNKPKWLLEGLPKTYLLQVGLYAYLLGVDKIALIASFLTEDDYKNPEYFKPDENNTRVFPIIVSKEYKDFYHEYIVPAIEWWNEHIVKGVSPQYDVFNTGDVELLKMIKNELAEKEKTEGSYTIDEIFANDNRPFY